MLLQALVLGFGQFRNTTQKCLESLLPEANALNIPIHLLDNGSRDDSAELQKAFSENHPMIQSKFSSENLGFAGGMNFLANNLDATWLLLIGSDTVFFPGALQKIYDSLDHIPNSVGIVGPVTNSAGTAQSLHFLGDKLEIVFNQAKEFFATPTNLYIPLYRADFFCVAIRKSLWDRLEGLDLSYGLGYYEDFDFSMRAKSIGYESCLIEDVLVFHQGSASFSDKKQRSKLLRKNKKIFINRFPEAQLRHVREDSFQTVEYLIEKSYSLLNKKAIMLRIDLRIQSLKMDLPKGWIKRWIWQKKIRYLEAKRKKIGQWTDPIKNSNPT
jgi:glycosyltransferase involved in cell wall biosynthesis